MSESNSNPGGGGPSVIPDQSGSGNHSGGGGSGGRRNRNRNRNHGGSNRGHQGGSRPLFDGREPTLKGHIYDLSTEKNSEQFLKTSKEIMNWVGREYTKYTSEFCQAVMDQQLVAPMAPVDPPNNNPVEFERWKIELKKHTDKEEAYQNFRARLFTVVLGQCTEALEDRLKSSQDWAAAQQDGLLLLSLIKRVTYTMEERRHLPDGLLDVKEEFYQMRQGKNESLQRYYERFKNQVAVMREVGVSIVDEALVNQVANSNGRTNAPTDADHDEAMEQTLAIRFIRGANKRFKTYLTELRHAALDGNNNYPETLALAYNIMQRREEATAPVFDGGGNEGVAFVTAGRNGRTHAHITCRNCNRVGHFADQCPEGDGREQGMVFACSVDDGAVIPRNWLLLDSQANLDLVCNREMLRNIRRVDSFMTVHCNAGSRRTNLMGDLPGYPRPVWYSPHAIANILSLCNVKNIPRWRVTYDSSNGDEFRVTKDDGKVVKFRCYDDLENGGSGPDGLYHCVTTSTGLTGVAMVSTIAENKSRFTNEEVSRAEKARFIQKVIGRPSTKDFIRFVTRNQLPNCPVTTADIVNAETIFGPDTGSLKGKTVRQAPPKVRIHRSLLPPDDLIRLRDVTLCFDLMHVNGIPFFISMSRKIKLGAVQELRSAKKAEVLKAFDAVRATYRAGGFIVTHALADGYFEPYRADLSERGVALNTTSRDEHQGDIERYIRTIKERVRCLHNSVPFKRVPGRMLIEMVKNSVFWRNSFPPEDGVSEHLSPRAIVTGQSVDFHRHCKYEYGEYVQTHEEHDNTMSARTVGALAMRPTGNMQGGHYFFSLATGRIINRVRATKLPMPSEVIDRVHTLARRQNANRGLVFGDRDGNPVDGEDGDWEWDDDDDSTYAPSDSGSDNNHEDDNDNHDDDQGHDDNDDDDGDDDDDDGYVVGSVDLDDDQDGDAGEGSGGILDNASNPPEQDDAVGSDDNSADGSIPSGEDDDHEHIVEPAADPEGTTGVDNPQDLEGTTGVGGEQSALEDEMDERYGPRTGAYGLRPRRQPNVRVVKGSRPKVNLVSNGSKVSNQYEVLATPQMNLKQGLKVFGDKGVEAVQKEMTQLHERKVMRPKHKQELTPEQRREALGYLMFLKRKRCGRVKGRGCADGRKQRAWIDPEDATAPTVSTEAVLMTAVIDAMERREVAVVDIPGAFMQADMDEEVFVRFQGRMAEILLEIDPKLYGPYVTYERKEMVLYVELLKALYGTLRAARLFWEKLTKTLKEWGFEANPYDSCVMNKMVNGKQLTVAWHVDDLKISHVDHSVVDHFIDQMDNTFGKEAPLSKSRGKVHDYLGMVLDFSVDGVLTVTMIDYIKMVLADLPDEFRGKATTPAADHLFKVNDDDAVKLSEEKAKMFHRIVMQLQYLSQRARPDLRTAVSFLCKRVTKCDEDDWKKLTRLTKYLDCTVDLPLRLSVDGSGSLYWYIDASFGVHHDMKGHTGGTFTMGGGSIYSTSSAQKIVARSSTEAELIGVHDVLPQMLWTVRFLEGQGLKVHGTILFQDNMSAMLLEKNGRASSSKRTRHIALRYYFVKEHVDSGAIEIRHCPTKEMWGDFFTKPVQGTLFLKLRDQVMNIDSNSSYHSSHRSVLEEREPTACAHAEFTRLLKPAIKDIPE